MKITQNLCEEDEPEFKRAATLFWLVALVAVAFVIKASQYTTALAIQALILYVLQYLSGSPHLEYWTCCLYMGAIDAFVILCWLVMWKWALKGGRS